MAMGYRNREICKFMISGTKGVFRPRGARAPEFLDKEPIDHYKKRS